MVEPRLAALRQTIRRPSVESGVYSALPSYFYLPECLVVPKERPQPKQGAFFLHAAHCVRSVKKRPVKTNITLDTIKGLFDKDLVKFVQFIPLPSPPPSPTFNHTLTTDSRELLLVRRTEPDRDVALLLARLNLSLPPQPPPRISLPKAH